MIEDIQWNDFVRIVENDIERHPSSNFDEDIAFNLDSDGKILIKYRVRTIKQMSHKKIHKYFLMRILFYDFNHGYIFNFQAWKASLQGISTSTTLKVGIKTSDLQLEKNASRVIISFKHTPCFLSLD